MIHDLIAPHIVMRPSIRGLQPAIERNGFKVRVLAGIHLAGFSAEEIADEYDLTRAEVYAGLAYYYDHKDEIDAQLAADDELERVFAPDDAAFVATLRSRLRGE